MNNHTLDSLLKTAREIITIHKSLVEDIPRSTPTSGEIQQWKYWIWSKNSDFFCQILSLSGQQFFVKCESIHEAHVTIYQLGQFHPGGEFSLGSPKLGFSLIPPNNDF